MSFFGGLPFGGGPSPGYGYPHNPYQGYGPPPPPNPPPGRGPGWPSTPKRIPVQQGEYPAEIRQAIDAVRKFTTNRMETKCHKCRSNITTDFNVKRWMKRWSEAALDQPQNAELMCAAECRSCRALTCLGCGEEPKKGSKPRDVRGHYIGWCCRDGRLFAMWVTLARFDQVELRIQTSGASADDSVGMNISRMFGAQTKGTGYGSSSNAFADMATARQRLHQPLEFQVSDAKTDYFSTLVLQLVTEMVPTKNNRNLPPELRGMLQLGSLIDKVAEFLRNDSLEDVSKRGELYAAVFRFVHKLGVHPDMISLVQSERHSKQVTTGLEAMSKSKGGRDVGLVLGDTIPSVAERLRQLAKQSEVVLSTTERDGLTAAGGQALIDLCRQIVTVHSEISIGEQESGSGTSAADRYSAYHQKHCVTRDDAVINGKIYHFYSAAMALSYSNPGRMKRMVTELATMATSLPVGIFVKVGESRPDIMKCLVMGPPDSPYGYGLFEFDLFCTQNYPHEPPVMVCRTAMGKKSLNPNLHSDGKVCLSLLGTWPGDAAAQWQPGKSTILSVLTSIQAMIFCEDPWRNEPGFANASGFRAERQARLYFQHVQKGTVKYGILEWMEKSTLRHSVWADIIRAHFTINKDRTRENIQKWSKSNPDITSSMVRHLNQSLDKLT